MTEVVGYRNDQSACFCTLHLTNGERVMISVAGAPSPSVKVVKLALGGLVPTRVLWKFNPAFAGGYEPYIRLMIAMFADPASEPKHPLEGMRDALIDCDSAQDVVSTLIRREKAAREGQSVGGPSQVAVDDAVRIVQAYAAVLEGITAFPFGAPDALLPAPRDAIKAALKTYAFSYRPLDSTICETLRIAYSSLALFVRDAAADRGRMAYAAFESKNPSHPYWGLLDEARRQREVMSFAQEVLLDEFDLFLHETGLWNKELDS